MTERQLERCLVSFVVGVALFLFGYLTYRDVTAAMTPIRSYNIEQDCVR